MNCKNVPWTRPRTRAIGVAVVAALAVSVPALTQTPMNTPPRDRGGRPVLPVTGTASISGIVTDAETGVPLERAIVSATCNTCNTEATRSVVTYTDAEGRYTLGGLSVGLYRVIVSARSHLHQAFGRPPGRSGPGRRIQVGAGERVRGIDVALIRGAVVAGRVTDPAGEPLPNADVSLYVFRHAGLLGPRLVMQQRKSTDDRGEFRLYGLSAGTYLVAAESDASSPLPENVRWHGDAREALVMTFAPGTPVTVDAQRIAVDVGQEVNADIQMVAGRLVTLAGRVVDSRGVPLPRGTITLRAADDPIIRDQQPHPVRRDGTFQIRGVAPGAYTLHVHSVHPNPMAAPDGAVPIESAAVEVLVGDEDLTDLNVGLSPPSTLTGRLVVEGDAAALRGATLTISGGARWPHRVLTPARVRGRVDDDRSIHVGGLTGHRVLRVSGLPRGWWVKAVRIDGQDALLGFDYGVGQAFTGLEIVVSDRPSRLVGRVTDSNGRPAVDATVVVIPEDLEHFEGFVVPGLGGTVRTDHDGRFDVEPIRPGRYYVAAVHDEDLPANLFDDHDSLRDLAARATHVAVTEGNREQVDLTVALP